MGAVASRGVDGHEHQGTGVPATLATQWETGHLARRAWLMVPAFVVAWFVTGPVSSTALGAFGLSEGDLILMAHSAATWAFDVVLWLVMISLPVAGVVLAAKAAPRAGGWSARAALAVSALITLVMLYHVFDEIRMSYFPHDSWPF